MNVRRLAALAAVLLFALVFAPARATTVAGPTTRDGSGDFNFLQGSWKTHYRLLKARFANSHEWSDCYGTATVRPFWNGSANLEDGDLKCPTKYIHGMTLRLYSAVSHQWSLYWGTQKIGLQTNAQVGHFDANGIGDFYGNDTENGKPVVVRYRWSLRSGDHPHFEQAESMDGGKTWETDWTTDYTRV